MNDRLSYRTHSDLLAQVASSAEEAREVRRILSAQLTEADLDAHARWKAAPIAACCGSCNQGRTKCATPDACQLPADDYEGDALGVFRVIGWCLAAWAVIVFAIVALK